MIKAIMFRNKSEKVYGFEVSNHGKSIVCAAVSMLVINTVNSIELFTEVAFNIEYDDKGGFIRFIAKDIEDCSESREFDVLMNSMVLGLKSAETEYKGQIMVIEINKEV